MKKKCRHGEDTPRRQAIALIERQRTLVLATSDQHTPWAAPVYYVYIAPAFFFFSSPQSTHMKHALNTPVISSTLFSDADQWEQIEGIQMVGRIIPVEKTVERLKVTTRYLKKFPMARSLLNGKGRSGLDVSAKVRLYAFYPRRIFYTNNQLGFGSRMEITL